ncbi:MAG TPA: DUF6677 family protein [Thermoguttaceae bacterium]|nr:DUF6677 family protein [Thermoguttaceae bacterium]
MENARSTSQKSDLADETAHSIPLKDPALAALLAWLIPGLGHAYQGRWAKAVLFFVCIMGTFVYGLYLGSDRAVGWGRVVYVMWQPEEKRLYYFCQIGVGLPAAPALVQAIRVRSGKEPLGTFMAPPRLGPDDPSGRVTLDEIHRRLARYFELGTIYTAIAGLLNVLAILDAWAGPVILATPGKKEDEEEKKEKAPPATSTRIP